MSTAKALQNDQDRILIMIAALLAVGLLIKFLIVFLISLPLVVIFHGALRGKNGSTMRLAVTLTLVISVLSLFIGIPSLNFHSDSFFQGLLYLLFPEGVQTLASLYAGLFAKIPLKVYQIQEITLTQMQWIFYAALPFSLLAQFLPLLKEAHQTPLVIWIDKKLTSLYSLPVFQKLSIFSTKPYQGDIFLGEEKESGTPMGLTEDQLVRHIYILGASGFGKSVAVQKIIKNRIFKDNGLMYLDLKSDSGLLRNIRSWVKDSGRENDLLIFNTNDLKATEHYNPLKNGNATQLKDLIIGSLVWTEDYYKKFAEGFLLRLLVLLVRLRNDGKLTLDLHTIYLSVSNPKFLANITSLLDPSSSELAPEAHELSEFIKDKENQKALKGLEVQLQSLTCSRFGEKLFSDPLSIDLFEAALTGKIVIFFLDSRIYGESVKALGKMILSDLKATSSRIENEIENENDRPLFPIIIDEFSDLATHEFLSFMDRARSSKFATIISHQEMMDLDHIDPVFAKRLINLTSTQLIFNSKIPESSDFFASIIGTETTEKETERVERNFLMSKRTGDKSLREAEAFRVHPNIFRDLSVGECVYISKYPSVLNSKILIERSNEDI